MPEVFVRVLGVVSIARDGVDVPLPPKQRHLLALFVASLVDGLTSDQLIDALYDGRPPSSVDAALRVHLAKLRDALEPDRPHGASTRLGKVNGRWRLRLERDEYDVGLLQSGDPSEVLRSATAEPFPGLVGPVIDDERARIESLRSSSVRRCVAALLDAGEAHDAAAALGRLLAAHPYDEAAAVLESRAVYQTSGVEPALARLRAFRQRLVDDLGLDPSEAITAAECALLANDPALRPRDNETAQRKTSLIGRSDLLRQIEDLAASRDAVCLSGVAGIGKTALLRELRGPHRLLVSAAADTPLALAHDILVALDPPAREPGWQALRAQVERGSTEGGAADLSAVAEDLIRRFLPHGTMLLVDDAERPDPPSAAVLRRLPRGSFRLLLARRPRAGGNDPWEPWRPTVVEIGPLNPEDSRRLAERLNPAAPPSGEDLVRTGGVPLLVEHAALPGSHLTIQQRVASALSPEAAELAATLAVVASPLPAQVAALPHGPETLEELLVSGIATERAGLVDLHHPAVADALRAATSSAASAETILRLIDLGAPALCLARAVPAHQPWLPADAVSAWAMDAGQASLRAGDPAAARDQFSMIDDPADRRWPEARHGIARAHLASGRVADARSELLGVMESYRSEQRCERLLAALDDYVGILAPQSADDIVVGSHARFLLGRTELTAASRVLLLDVWAAASPDDELEVRTKELLAECERVGTSRSMLMSLTGQWRMSYRRGEPARARLPLSQAAVELARQLGDDALTVQVLRHRVDDLVACCQRGPAESAAAELHEVATRSHNSQGRWWCELLDVARELREGRPAQALAAAAEAYERWDRMPVETRDDVFQLQAFVAMFMERQYDELASALADVAHGPLAHEVPDGLLGAARLMLDASAGRADAATVRQCADNLLAQPAGWRRAAELYLAARAAILVDVDAPGLRAALLPYSGSWVLLGTSLATLGPVDAALAGLHRVAGHDTDARHFHTKAIGDCKAMNAPTWARDIDTMRINDEQWRD